MLQMLSPLDLHTLETAWTWGVATFATPHVLYSVLGAGVCWLVWRLFLHRAEQPPPPLWQSAPNGYNESKRPAAFPHPFPTGWYRLMYSDELKAGQVLPVSALGREFAVFRTLAGKAHVLDAHCRHLGANIAVGGHVIGDCLECPFHGWQYRGEDGACTSIPYSEPGSKIPPQANNLAWPVFEYAGMVCVFFHEAYDRKMSEQPDYPPYYPPPAPCESPDWQWYGRWKTRTTMHIQEFSENAADYAHFNQVHDRLAFLHRWFFLQHELSWKVGFTKLVRKHERHLVAQLPNEPHYISSFIDYPEVYFSPWPRSTASSSRAHVPAEQWDKVLELPADASWWQRLKARVTHLLRPRCIWPGFTVAIVTLIGPNSIVYFMFHTAYGDILLIKTYLPIEPLLQQVEDSWFAEKRVPRWLVNFIVTEARNAFRDDVLIWDRKTYLSKPLFVRNDGPIPKLRRWYRQFYPTTTIQQEGEEEREDRRSQRATSNDLAW